MKSDPTLFKMTGAMGTAIHNAVSLVRIDFEAERAGLKETGPALRYWTEARLLAEFFVSSDNAETVGDTMALFARTMLDPDMETVSGTTMVLVMDAWLDTLTARRKGDDASIRAVVVDKLCFILAKARRPRPKFNLAIACSA